MDPTMYTTHSIGGIAFLYSLCVLMVFKNESQPSLRIGGLSFLHAILFIDSIYKKRALPPNLRPLLCCIASFCVDSYSPYRHTAHLHRPVVQGMMAEATWA